ncbi:unnamed protein product [Toxocara canis]|uniref:G_PROTEIN_RECEP_F1_2 domain-containing protein n=1 Tax=Toxocara canis TaxID=6265 RepID=A0A183UAY6_TOXCA|nr:unnamed protein product [Toxocara canis]
MWEAVVLFIAPYIAVLPSILFMCRRSKTKPVSIASLFQVKKKHKLRSNRRHKRKAAVVEKTITLNVRPMTMDEEDAAGLQTFIDSRLSSETTHQTTAGDEQIPEDARRRTVGGATVQMSEDQSADVRDRSGLRCLRKANNSDAIRQGSNSIGKNVDPNPQIQPNQASDTDDDKNSIPRKGNDDALRTPAYGSRNNDALKHQSTKAHNVKHGSITIDQDIGSIMIDTQHQSCTRM